MKGNVTPIIVSLAEWESISTLKKMRRTITT